MLAFLGLYKKVTELYSFLAYTSRQLYLKHIEQALDFTNKAMIFLLYYQLCIHSWHEDKHS